MEFAKLNPYVRYARAHQNIVRPLEPAVCYDCRLFYFHKASGTFQWDQQTQKLVDGTVVYLPPGSTYTLILDKISSNGAVLVLNFDLVDSFSHLDHSLGTARVSHHEPDKILTYETPALGEIIVQKMPRLYEPLSKCIEEFLSRPPYYRENISAMVKLCLVELLRSSSLGEIPQRIAQVMQYVAANYADPALTVQKIAAEFGYHPNYISQVFKESTDHTLRDYLTHYRIRMAKNLLRTTELDVGTVGWKCGFNSVSYFIKVFRQHTGMTPHKFQKSTISQLY